MKNYYEILEVNEHASEEIIKKAYKVLIKKYHPDLYTGEEKQYAEKKTRDINEAYKILSDDFLKEQYDAELQREKIEQYKKKNEIRDKVKINQKNKETKNIINKDTTNSSNTQEVNKYQVGSIKNIFELTKELIPDRKNIKELPKVDMFALSLTIVIIIILGIILWFIPFTNGWMRQLLFENPISQIIGKLFGK